MAQPGKINPRGDAIQAGGGGVSPFELPQEIFDTLGDTLKQLQDAILGVVNVIKPFVDAIAPGAVMQFNQALRALQATIGSGLISALNVFSSVVREISGILLPTVQKMEPIVKLLAEAIGNKLLASVKVITGIFEALAPVLQLVAEIERRASVYLLDLGSVVTALGKAIGEVLEGLIASGAGGGIKDFMKSLGDIVRQVTKALITLAATLAVAAGAAGLVSKFGDALEREARDRDARRGGLLPAGTDPSIHDVSAIVRAAQLSAFTAQGGGGDRGKTDTQWLMELADSVRAIRDENKSLRQMLTEWWNNEVLGGETGLFGRVVSFFNRISATIEGFFKNPFRRGP